MDNTIHNQSVESRECLSHADEKKDNFLSDLSSCETRKEQLNEQSFSSGILNGDSLKKCEPVNGMDMGNSSKSVDGTVVSDAKSVSEEKLQTVAGSLGEETSAELNVTASSKPENNENGSEEEEKEEWMDILGSGQLKKKVLRPGTSSFRPARSWLCQVTYEACLPDGKVVEKCENLNIQIGDGEVIEGLDLVLPLMDVGELALVEVAPRFAYSSLGLHPNIPPNATLLYTVDLLSAQPEPELEDMPIAERKKIGNKKRSHGNKWYERQKYTLAIQCYRRALEYLDETVDEAGGVKESDEELHSLLEDRLKVYNNMAAAQMKIEAYDAALSSVGNVLLCEPNNVKALYRKGKILRGMGNNVEARAVLAKASSLSPDNKLIQKELQAVSQVCKVEARKEKDLYKKMFTTEAAAAEPKTSKRQIPWGTIVGSVSAAAIAILASLAAYKYRFV